MTFRTSPWSFARASRYKITVSPSSNQSDIPAGYRDPKRTPLEVDIPEAGKEDIRLEIKGTTPPGVACFRLTGREGPPCASGRSCW
jgi:hypothetical protein